MRFRPTCSCTDGRRSAPAAHSSNSALTWPGSCTPWSCLPRTFGLHRAPTHASVPPPTPLPLARAKDVPQQPSICLNVPHGGTVGDEVVGEEVGAWPQPWPFHKQPAVTAHLALLPTLPHATTAAGVGDEVVPGLTTSAQLPVLREPFHTH
jgi:hypothetical protein